MSPWDADNAAAGDAAVTGFTSAGLDEHNHSHGSSPTRSTRPPR
jgi:hypothetical protein